MSILISMQVGPVDWGKFKAAVDWANAQAAAGHIGRKVYRAEDDSSTVLVLEEWESHEAFHKMADALGPEFNRRAGTEGLEWIDRSWAQA